MSQFYKNRNRKEPLIKIGSKYENIEYATKNTDPSLSSLNRQLYEEEHLSKCRKKRQLEEYSYYAKALEKPPAIYQLSRDNITGKIGQEKFEEDFQKYQNSKSKVESQLNVRLPNKDMRSINYHGYNIINNNILGFCDPNQKFPSSSYKSTYQGKSLQGELGNLTPEQFEDYKMFRDRELKRMNQEIKEQSGVRPQLTQQQMMARQVQDPRDIQDPRQMQDSRQIEDPRQYRDPRQLQDPRQYQDPRDIQDPRQYQDPGQSQDPRQYQDPRQLQDPRQYQDPRQLQDPRQPQEPIKPQRTPSYQEMVQRQKAAQEYPVQEEQRQVQKQQYREEMERQRREPNQEEIMQYNQKLQSQEQGQPEPRLSPEEMQMYQAEMQKRAMAQKNPSQPTPEEIEQYRMYEEYQRQMIEERERQIQKEQFQEQQAQQQNQLPQRRPGSRRQPQPEMPPQERLPENIPKEAFEQGRAQKMIPDQIPETATQEQQESPQDEEYKRAYQQYLLSQQGKPLAQPQPQPQQEVPQSQIIKPPEGVTDEQYMAYLDYMRQKEQGQYPPQELNEREKMQQELIKQQRANRPDTDPEYLKRCQQYEDLIQDGEPEGKPKEDPEVPQTQIGPIGSQPKYNYHLAKQIAQGATPGRISKSNFVEQNPYTNKNYSLGESGLKQNPILHPINSYKFDYNRLNNPLVNPNSSIGTLASAGNNIISK